MLWWSPGPSIGQTHAERLLVERQGPGHIVAVEHRMGQPERLVLVGVGARRSPLVTCDEAQDAALRVTHHDGFAAAGFGDRMARRHDTATMGNSVACQGLERLC